MSDNNGCGSLMQQWVCCRGPTLADSKKIAKLAIDHWSLATSPLPIDIKLRGVGKEVLPHYPYRDDGKRVWDAIEDFVGKYFGAYYTSTVRTKAHTTSDLRMRCCSFALCRQHCLAMLEHS